MLEIKDASGRVIMIMNDNGETIVKDKSVAKDIYDNIINNGDIKFIEEDDK